ncbi:ARID DNA-binding domain-containing protein [Tanacetum coccineum]
MAWMGRNADIKDSDSVNLCVKKKQSSLADKSVEVSKHVNEALGTNSPTITPNVVNAEDVGNVPVWVKLHGVPMTTFSDDGLSAIATKLGTPLMIDSYTSDMFMQSWGHTKLICACCKIFGHVQDECPKYKSSDVAKNLKNPIQDLRGVPVGPKVGFKPVKQVYRALSKKNIVNTSGNKKKDVESRKEVSNPNPFDVLISVENDVELGTNEGFQI